MDILKLADASLHEVAGVIASQDLDRDGECFDYDGSKSYFQKWSQDLYNATKKTAAPGEESYGNVRLMHGKQVAGKLTKIIFDDVKKTIWGICKVTDDKVWDDIQKGIYSAFSIAGKLIRSVLKNGKEWITVQPLEVSIVDYPSNPTTTFDWARGACFAKFANGINTPDPAYAPDAVPPQGDPSPGPVVNPTPGTQVKDGLQTVRPNQTDTQDNFEKPEYGDKKATMISPVSPTTPSQTEKPTTAMMNPDGLYSFKTSEGTYTLKAVEVEKRDVSAKERQELADKGHALPDGSFPIAHKEDLKNAVQAVGRASDYDKAKKHIIARAKDLGATDLLPADWEGSTKEKVSPPGWSGTVEEMKDHPEIDNPWALAWWMEGEGYTPHKASMLALWDVWKSLGDDDPAKQRSVEHAVTDPYKHPTTQGVDTDGVRSGLSDSHTGAKKMADRLEVQKAARKSMADHFGAMKAMVTKHAADMHDLVDKCMKLAGPAFDADSEHEGGQPASGSPADTEVKAALMAEIQKLAAKVDELSKAAKPAEKVDPVVGDPKDAVKTGVSDTEKAAAAKKDADATQELAKAAFGVGPDGKRQPADPKAMSELYKKVTTRSKVMA